MTPQSARALASFSGLLIILALVIMSPTAAFALLVLAALCTAFPAAYSAGRIRVWSVLLVVVSLALAVGFYPSFRHDQDAYRRRRQEPSVKPMTTARTGPEMTAHLSA